MSLKDKNSVEKLATLAYELIDRVSETGDALTTPDLTRQIFGITEDRIPHLLKMEEFDAMCNAVDFLVAEGSITFNTEDGTLTRGTRND